MADTNEPPHNWGPMATDILEFFKDKVPAASFAMDEEGMIECFDKMVPQSRINAKTKESYLAMHESIENDFLYQKKYSSIGSAFKLNVDSDELFEDIIFGLCGVMSKFGGKKSLDKLFELMLSSTHKMTVLGPSIEIANSDIISRIGDTAEYSRIMQEYIANKPIDEWAMMFKEDRLGNVAKEYSRYNFIKIFHMVDKGQMPFSEKYEQYLIAQLEDYETSVSLSHSANCELSAFSPYGGKALHRHLSEMLATLRKTKPENHWEQEEITEANPKLETAIADICRRMNERRKSEEVARVISRIIPSLSAYAAKKEHHLKQ